jgi:heat shock protein HtpX
MAALMTLFGIIGFTFFGRAGLLIAFGVALALNIGSYWFSDKIVLRMYKATEVDRNTAPDLYAMVDNLRQRAGLPMPRVFIVPSDQPNAFATGRNPANAAVAVTSGLQRMLNERELAGVIAHELAHIQNRDILTSTIAATIASAITLVARFGFFAGGDNDRGGLLGGLLMLIVAPIAAMLIQMAVSRVREYSADRDGAAIAGDPRALASALSKLHAGATQIPMASSPATAHMFIVNPFTASGLGKLFSTHPPAEERIRRLLATTPGGQ